MNIEEISSYIRSGEKSSLKTGIEIEHFIVDENNESVTYHNGVSAILEEIAPFFDKKIYSENYLIALSNGRYHLTLEPASQLEISIEPCNSIDDIKSEYEDFLKIITPVLEKSNLRLVTYGYQPKSKVKDLELIPKKRYVFMDKYFRTTGKYGINMMRGTASTQISIDYENEEDCAKKYKLANILSPVFAMLCDNSPIFEGENYNGRMVRAKIWSDLDDDRCGILECAFNNFSYNSYAEYLADAPAILIMENGDTLYTGEKKIKDIYKNRSLSTEEIEHLLSMFFPDVRLKQYIEIRPADSMQIEYALSYAALVKGIFNSSDIVCEFLNTDSISYKDALSAYGTLMKDGFDAVIYNKKVTQILERLAEISVLSLNESEKKYLAPIRNIISQKRTLKDNFVKGN